MIRALKACPERSEGTGSATTRVLKDEGEPFRARAFAEPALQGTVQIQQCHFTPVKGHERSRFRVKHSQEGRAS